MYQKYIDYVWEYLPSHNGNYSPNKRHGFRSRASHSERVYKLVKELSVDIPCINKDVLYLSAIFHDVGYCNDIDNSNHAESSANIFKEFAVSNKIDIELSNNIF